MPVYIIRINLKTSTDRFAVILRIFHNVAAVMLSASFHSGCRQGSLVGAAIRPAAKEVYAQLNDFLPVKASMTLGLNAITCL